MKQRPLVVLLGESLLMDGVAASLAGKEMLGTVQMGSDGKDIQEHLETLQPDLVIFELGTPTSTAILPLLSQQPGIQLMGLDPACSRVIMLNSQQHPTPTMHELYQVVQAETAKQVNLPQVDLPQVDSPQAHPPKGGELTTRVQPDASAEQVPADDPNDDKPVSDRPSSRRRWGASPERRRHIEISGKTND